MKTNKESNEPDYNDDNEKSDKAGEDNQEHDMGEITINQVFDHCCHTF